MRTLHDLDAAEEEKMDVVGGIALLEDPGSLFVRPKLAQRLERPAIVFVQG